VVGANGQRQAMFLENVQGFGPVLSRNFAVTRDDALLAISSSGCNAMTIDVAIEARLQGMFVVALTSQANAAASTSWHQSGRKLHEVADLVLDQQAPPGDSAVCIKDLQTPVAPLSSITSCTIINLIKAEVARLLTEAGHPPRSSPPPAIWAPIAPDSFSRKRLTTTAAAWECFIAEGHSRQRPAQTLSRPDAWCRGDHPAGW